MVMNIKLCLAPYGKGKYLEQLREIITWNKFGEYSLNMNFFTHNSREFKTNWQNGSPYISNCFSKSLIELLGEPRGLNQKLNQKHFDIARSTQIIYEEAFFNLLNYLNIRYKSRNLCLAGGCAANSVANGKILSKTNFKSVYIQAAPGMPGALGAAYLVYKKGQN